MNFSHIWNTLVVSNTFNFVIFLALFALIFKKINIKAIFDKIQADIVKILETAQKQRDESRIDLANAQKAVENLGDELKVIVEDAEKSAVVVGEKILTEAKKQLESIEANAEKVISAEEKMLISKLAKSTSNASVEVAKTHIKNILVDTPTLHEKYINESIDGLDRLNF